MIFRIAQSESLAGGWSRVDIVNLLVAEKMLIFYFVPRKVYVSAEKLPNYSLGMAEEIIKENLNLN